MRGHMNVKHIHSN